MVPTRFILENTKDELNFYLTMHGLKPASEITPRGHIKGFVYEYGFGGLKKLCNSLFEKQLQKKNVPFVNEGECFLIGYNSESLERLVKAENSFETGIALGYPLDAVEYHCNFSRAYPMLVKLAKARDAEIKVPSWMAYISFIMGDFDLAQKRFPEAGKELGIRYREFTRENYPHLAKRVEKEFRKGELLPEEWKIMENGDYSLISYIPRKNKTRLVLED